MCCFKHKRLKQQTWIHSEEKACRYREKKRRCKNWPMVYGAMIIKHFLNCSFDKLQTPNNISFQELFAEDLTYTFGRQFLYNNFKYKLSNNQ